jgi:hypothetical protein
MEPFSLGVGVRFAASIVWVVEKYTHTHKREKRRRGEEEGEWEGT